jgi:hypothetical protein
MKPPIKRYDFAFDHIARQLHRQRRASIAERFLATLAQRRRIWVVDDAPRGARIVGASTAQIL